MAWISPVPGHPGNEDSQGHALWIINGPHTDTHTDTLMSQVVHNPQNTAYHSLLLRKSLEFAKSSSVCTQLPNSNRNAMSACKYMHACASVMLKNTIAVPPINTSLRMQLPLPHNCVLRGDIKPSVPGGEGGFSQDPLGHCIKTNCKIELSVAVICIYKYQ